MTATSRPSFKAKVKTISKQGTNQPLSAVLRQLNGVLRGWIDDPPSAASARGVVEAGAISLLTNCGSDIVDAASPTWLGRYAYREAIVDSGLWNVRHVRDAPSVRALEVVAAWIDELPQASRRR